MTYPGGKNGAGVYQTLINLMPPHARYIEPFLGGGAILRLKRPAQERYALLAALRAGEAADFWTRTGAGAGTTTDYTHR